MRIVPDTNFLISAMLWDNSVSHRLLIKLIEKDIEIFTIIRILKEFKEVIARDFEYHKNPPRASYPALKCGV